MGLKNVFDKNSNGDTLCGFLGWLFRNRNGCTMKNVVTDIIK
jgi:hypothetical protein